MNSNDLDAINLGANENKLEVMSLALASQTREFVIKFV